MASDVIIIAVMITPAVTNDAIKLVLDSVSTITELILIITNCFTFYLVKTVPHFSGCLEQNIDIDQPLLTNSQY